MCNTDPFFGWLFNLCVCLFAVYPDLVAEEEMSDGGEGAGGGARKREGEDHMWTPGGGWVGGR